MATQSLPTTTAPDRRVLVAFVVFVLVSGGASVAIRVTYGEMAPFWSGALRFILAALVFWVLVAIKRIPLPRGRALIGALLFGALTVGLAFILIGWGLVATPASTYQILMALIPLYTLFLSALQGVESLHKRGIVGALLALVGIIITVGGGTTGGLSLPHILAVLLAGISIAEGGVVLKKFPPNPPLATNAIGMSVGAVMLAAASLIAGEAWTIPTQTNTWIAFLYLVFIVTILAFMTYLFVLRNWTASATSYGFVLIPLVTMVLAAVLVGEQITLNFLIGAAFVLSGVFIGALLPSKTHTAAVVECKDRSGQVLPRCM